MTRIYKLLDAAAWEEASRAGLYEGSAADLADGFIHFSKADQLAETARRHFAGVRDLVCLVVEADGLADLRWEPSRGGALFPHLYGHLQTSDVIDVAPAPLDADAIPSIEPDRL